MRKSFTFVVLLIFAATWGHSQMINLPHTQDFENFNLCSTGCGAACSLTQGWVNPTTGDNINWLTDNGGTSSSATGPSVDHNPGTSAGKYLYMETSCSGTGYPSRSAHLVSPQINLAGSNAPKMDFWWHMYGSTQGTMQVQVDSTGTGNGPWVNVSPAPWTNNVDQWFLRTIDLAPWAGDTIRIRVRGVSGSSFSSDMAVDNFRFYDLLPNDAGIAVIDSPSVPACNLGNNVYVSVANYGTDTMTSVTLNLSINGVAQPTTGWTGSLAPGEIDSLVSLGSFTINAGDSICAWTTLPNGQTEPISGRGNDTACVKVELGLSGMFTIGPDSTDDYNNFRSAISDLERFGVCGPVVFEVDSGNYNEQLVIREVIGASQTNTITFRPAAGAGSGYQCGNEWTSANWSKVRLWYSSFSSTTNYTILLDGADHFIFEDIILEARGFSYGHVLEVQGESEWNWFERCQILGDTTPSTTSTFMAPIYSNTGSNDDHNTFNCNLIQGGSYAVWWYGAALNNNEDGTTFSGNYLKNQYYYGIRLYYQENATITDNLFRTNSFYTGSVWRIYLFYHDGKLTVTNNRLDSDKYGYGIYLGNCVASANNRSLVANNMLRIGFSGSTASSYGFYLTNAGYVDLVNNNVNMTSNGTFTRALYVAGGGANNVWNNNFVNDGPGYAVYVTSAFGVTAMDYNNLYCPNGRAGYWSGDRTTLADWQNASQFDQNGVSVDPGYFGTDDLHVCNDTLDGAGFALTNLITDDFDGQPRDTSAFDIGADEFISIANFTLGPDVDLCSGDSVTLTAGSPGDTISWSTGATSPSITVSTPGTYSVTVSSFCGGTVNDNITINAAAEVYSNYLVADTSFACDGDVVTLSTTRTADSYVWSTGDTTASIQVTTSGNYTLSLTDRCGAGTEALNVTFSSRPTAAFTAVESFLTCQFTDGSQSNGGNNTYLWNFGDGNSSTMQNPTHIYAQPGQYNVTLIVTNECGSDSVVGVCNTTVVGLQESLLENGVEVVPNPNNGQFDLRFDLDGSKQVQVSVMNLQGQEVLNVDLGNIPAQYKQSLSLTDASAGVYFVRIMADGHSVVKKMIVE